MATLLKERSTYWVISNGSSGATPGDYRCYWKIYYEQSDSDKLLLRTKLTIDYYLQFYNKVNSNITYDDTTTSTVYINGSSIGGISISFSAIATSQLIKKGSKSTYIYHDKTTGEASFTFQGKGFGKNTAVSTYSLPKINVATTISNNSSSSNYINFGNNVTFTLTRPNDTHNSDVYYVINNTTYTIASNTSATSIDYAFSPDLISNYPNNANISLVVYCKNLTSGLVRETTVYLKVPDTYKPSISVTTNDTNSTCKNWGIYVKSQSKLEVIITASGISGSTIKSYSSNIGDYNSSLQSFTTSPLNPTISSGDKATMTLTSKVTDTRDKTNSVSKNFEVYNYYAPTFVKCELVRCNSDGTYNNVGTYAKVVCEYRIASCNSKNAKSLVVSYGSTSKTFTLSSYEGTVTATSSQLFSGFATDKNYNFTFTLSDSFGSSQLTVVLKSAYITRSFRAGGKGVTFGQLATEDGFHDYMGARFHNGLRVDGNTQVIDIISSGNFISSNGTFTTDPTNSFQSTIFGSNNYYWRIKPIRSGINTNNKFPIYSSGIAFSGGDTHGVLFTEYQKEYARAYIGAGSSNKLNWMKEVAFKDDDWKSIWTGTLLGGNTINLNVAIYSKLKVYARCHSIAFAFEVDLNQVIKPQVDGYDYGGGGVSAYINNDNLIEHHSCEINVNTAKTVIFARHLGYTKGSSTYLRNNNESYFVYKIEAK